MKGGPLPNLVTPFNGCAKGFLLIIKGLGRKMSQEALCRRENVLYDIIFDDRSLAERWFIVATLSMD